MDTERFNRATSLLDSGEVAAALREFEFLTEAESNIEEKSALLLNQVACLVQQGRFTEARERWSEAVACCRDLYTEYFDLSLCVAEGRLDEATSKLADFLKKRPDLTQSDDEILCSDAAEKVGNLLFERGLYDAAIGPYQAVLAFSETPEREQQVCLSIAICHIQTGNFDAAERVFRESIIIRPEDKLWPTVQYHLGRMRFKKGEYAKARTAFELSQLSTADDGLRFNISLWLEEIDQLAPPLTTYIV